jgi:hypothetical protein
MKHPIHLEIGGVVGGLESQSLAVKSNVMTIEARFELYTSLGRKKKGGLVCLCLSDSMNWIPLDVETAKQFANDILSLLASESAEAV